MTEQREEANKPSCSVDSKKNTQSCLTLRDRPCVCCNLLRLIMGQAGREHDRIKDWIAEYSLQETGAGQEDTLNEPPCG